MKSNILISGKRKAFGLAFWGCIFLISVYGQSSFTRGEELFLQNKPREALIFLETAVNDDPAHVRAFIYLGIVYEQLNRFDDAIAAYTRILPRGGAETARIAFNLGNIYFTLKNFPMALQTYTRALDADPSYSAAYLNRANTRIQMGLLAEALTDYEKYLTLEPRSAQRGLIEHLIVFIKDEFAAEERRVQEERAAEERRRIAAEQAAREEAERRQRLLAEVTASLQAAAEDSTSLSAGNENIEGYQGVFELE